MQTRYRHVSSAVSFCAGAGPHGTSGPAGHLATAGASGEPQAAPYSDAQAGEEEGGGDEEDSDGPGSDADVDDMLAAAAKRVERQDRRAKVKQVRGRATLGRCMWVHPLTLPALTGNSDSKCAHNSGLLCVIVTCPGEPIKTAHIINAASW